MDIPDHIRRGIHVNAHLVDEQDVAVAQLRYMVQLPAVDRTVVATNMVHDGVKALGKTMAGYKHGDDGYDASFHDLFFFVMTSQENYRFLGRLT